MDSFFGMWNAFVWRAKVTGKKENKKLGLRPAPRCNLFCLSWAALQQQFFTGLAVGPSFAGNVCAFTNFNIRKNFTGKPRLLYL